MPRRSSASTWSARASSCIDAGRVKLYSVDSVNGRAMLAHEGDAGRQAWVHHQFLQFIRHELVPAVRADCASGDIELRVGRRVDRRVQRGGLRVPASRPVPRRHRHERDVRPPTVLRRSGRQGTTATRLRSRSCPDSAASTSTCSAVASWCWRAARAPTRTSVSHGAWPTCSAPPASRTGSTHGARSGSTTGRCGARCCRVYLDELEELMGHQTAGSATDRHTAIRWMLRDLQALQAMLRAEMFETDVRRIGAEQEMFLVDASWQPAPGALAVLAALTGQPYTTEVGAFNLELNLDPQEFGGDCFVADARPARPAPRRRPRRGRGRRAAHRARRHAADDPQARPVDGQHGAEPPLPRAQRSADGPARRGLLRAAHQGRRRAARAPGLGDGGGVQRQLPGAPAGDARRVRQRLQHGPGDHRADARVAPPTRRCCSASGCGPRRASPCSSSRSTPAGRVSTCASAAGG